MMMLLALQLAAIPTVDAARTPEQRDKICLAAFSYLAGQPKTLEAGKLGATFFTGKLLGRNPGADLVAALRQAMPVLSAQLQPELLRCSRELEAAGNAMVMAGAALQGGK